MCNFAEIAKMLEVQLRFLHLSGSFPTCFVGRPLLSIMSGFLKAEATAQSLLHQIRSFSFSQSECRVTEKTSWQDVFVYFELRFPLEWAPSTSLETRFSRSESTDSAQFRLDFGRIGWKSFFFSQSQSRPW